MIGGMKKGLFGKAQVMPGVMGGYGGGRFTPGIGDGQAAPSMPQSETMQHTPEMQRMLSNVPLPKEGPGWKDVLISAIGGAADGAGQFFGNAPTFAIQRNQQAQMQAQALRDQAMRLAGMQDFMAKRKFEAENPLPTEFERIMQLGNIDPQSAEGQALARQRATRIAEGPDPMLQNARLPNGGEYTGPFSGYSRMMGGEAPTRPVGRLTPIDEGTAPTILNTPAPQIGANGMPAAVNGAQYQAIVEAMGPQQAADWARRNNVRVGQ